MTTAKRRETKQTPNNKKNTHRKGKQIQKNDNEIYGVVAIACSLIFMFSLYTSKLGYLSVISKKICISLFGIGAFLVPIYCIYISIKYYFLKQKVYITRKYWGIIGIILTTLVLLQTINMGDYYSKEGLIDSLGNFLVSNSFMNGGFIVFILILPLYKFIGDIGLYIVIIASYVICSILIFNYNIRGVASDVHKKSKRIHNKAKNRINAQKTRDLNVKSINQQSDCESTLSEAYNEGTFREEIRNRMKMIEFMNNSTLGEDEFYDDEIIEGTENANKVLEKSKKIEAIKEKELIKENSIFDDNPMKIVYGQAKDFKEEKEEYREEETTEKEITIPRKNKSTIIEEKAIKESLINDTQKQEIRENTEEKLNVAIKENEVEELCKNNYSYPSADLLNINTKSELSLDERRELVESSNKLEEVLLSFGVEAKLLDVTKGPSVTRFEIQPKSGIKVNKIVNLSHDIALGLAAAGEVRIEAPIPGKAAVGIEIPNKKQTPV